MRFVVSTLQRAELDIDRTYIWLADRSKQGAAHWYQAAREAISRLANDAAEHGLAPESSKLGADIRQKFFRTRRGRPYRVIYTVVGNEARVLRIRGPGQAPVTAEDISEGIAGQ